MLWYLCFIKVVTSTNDSFFNDEDYYYVIRSERQDVTMSNNYFIHSCIFEDITAEFDGCAIRGINDVMKVLVKSCGFKNIQAKNTESLFGGVLSLDLIIKNDNDPGSRFLMDSCYASSCSISSGTGGFLYIACYVDPNDKNNDYQYPDINVNITNCVVSLSEADTSSIYMDHGFQYITSLNSTSNNCKVASALVVRYPRGKSQISYSNFVNNNASERTIIQCEDEQHVIKFCNINSNTVPTSSENNAIIFASDSSVDVENCRFSGNTQGCLFSLGGTSLISSSINVRHSQLDETIDSPSVFIESSNNFQSFINSFIGPEQIWGDEEFVVQKTFNERVLNRFSELLRIYFFFSLTSSL